MKNYLQILKGKSLLQVQTTLSKQISRYEWVNYRHGQGQTRPYTSLLLVPCLRVNDSIQCIKQISVIVRRQVSEMHCNEYCKF